MVFQDNIKKPAWIAGIWLALLFSGCSQTVVPEGEVPPGMEGGQPIVITDPGMMPPMSMGQHVVQKGDTLYAIARQYGMNFRDLAAINGIGSPYTIHPGQTLMLSGGGVNTGGGEVVIPMDMGDMPPADGGGYAQPVYTEPAPVYAPPPVSSSGYYTVQRGDTLYSIASRLGYHYRDVAAWNGLQPPYTLSAGQSLRVTPSSTPVMAAPSSPTQVVSGVHTVQAGDTVYSLSRRYGMSVGQLAQMNGLNPPYNLRVGQQLRVGGVTASSAAKTVYSAPAAAPVRQFYHVAQPGEGIDSIAMRYKVSPLDIATWNGMSAPYYVNPGQRLLILTK
jgi:LysM repeat protein